METKQRPVPGQNFPDPLDEGLDKRAPGSYLCSFNFPLPDHLTSSIDYESILKIRQVGTIERSQTLQELPQDDEPYTKKFPINLEFVNRLNLPLFDWVTSSFDSLGVPSEGRPLVLAHAPNQVIMHRDNGMFAVILLPLRGVSFGTLWFADNDRQLVLKTKLVAGRAYLLNVSQFHGLWLPPGLDFWFVRHCFQQTTYKEVQQQLASRFALSYGC